jgi:peptidoglycan/LPS O-acetylase OafA/YrhL
MAGALLAVAVRSNRFLPAKFIRLAWISFFVAASLAFVTETFNARWIVFSFAAAASASFVYLALFSAQKWFRMLMTNRFLVYTGTISYGLYLLHKIPFGMVQAFHLDRHPLLELLIILGAGYGMAILSWNLLEKPFLNLKRFFEAKPKAWSGLDLPIAVVRE